MLVTLAFSAASALPVALGAAALIAPTAGPVPEDGLAFEVLFAFTVALDDAAFAVFAVAQKKDRIVPVFLTQRPKRDSRRRSAHRP